MTTVDMSSLRIQPQEKILERYRNVAPRDPLGFEASHYVPYMTYENAEEFLKEEFQNDEETRKEWGSGELDVESTIIDMKEYMDFAWDKANNFRGISSDRSIRHYVAWTWLIGDVDFSAKIDNSNYEYYGKPILVMICQHYGWDHKKWDDGVRVNSER